MTNRALGTAAGILVWLLAAVTPMEAQKPAPSPHGTLSLECTVCHNTSSWKVTGRMRAFDHARTGFPLLARHAGVRCRDCHQELVFSHVGSACADCHLDVHRGRLGSRCEQCHTPGGWENRGRLFEEHAARGFPLIGIHAVTDCEACHTGAARQDFAGAPVTCAGCHAADYQATRNPAHAPAGFGTECSQCHLPAGSWNAAAFQHPGAFPLRNAHARVDCQACHANGYVNTSPLCYSCHAAQYAGAQDPPHASGGFPTDCTQCHSDAGWSGANFDHAAATGFALTGAHATTACTNCHANNQWAGLPRDCFGCHATAYNNTSQPPHAGSGIPTTCEQCHTTATWGNGTFDHSTTGFALTGAHATTACTNCHANGQWTGLPQDCNGCHASAYAGTNNPPHAAAGFPTTCQTCHTTVAWTPSTWNHDTFFPLSSGSHAQFSSSCTTCHNNPGNYAVFDCIDCHTHNQTTTDSEHREVSNYQYASSACYSCHPRGSGGH